MEPITIDGRELPTPAEFQLRGEELWCQFPEGYFGEEEGTYYHWWFWGHATPVNLDAIAKAGIPVIRV